jgi:hypothetical protein
MSRMRRRVLRVADLVVFVSATTSSAGTPRSRAWVAGYALAGCESPAHDRPLFGTSGVTHNGYDYPLIPGAGTRQRGVVPG